MAKRKTAKVEDLRPKTITEEQLKKVQTIINDLNRGQLELGIMETKKHNMLHHITMIQDELTLIQAEFEKQYNTSNINIQTGEIKYNDNGKTNKKN
jgi:hypothetical protein